MAPKRVKRVKSAATEQGADTAINRKIVGNDGKITAPPNTKQKGSNPVPITVQNHAHPPAGHVDTQNLKKPAQPLPEPRCPRCSAPCWLCHVPDTPPQVPGPDLSDDDWGMAAVPQHTPSYQRTSRQISKRIRADGRIYLGPKEAGFAEMILEKNSITMDCMSKSVKAASVFETNDHFPDSEVFLQLSKRDVATIHTHFRVGLNREHDEKAIAHWTSSTLALSDPLVYRDEGERLISYRRDEWRPRIGGPPVLSETHFFDWDIQPDITYCVSTAMFAPKTRHLLTAHGICVLGEPDGVSPYLTIEFKCTEKGGKTSHARNQIAAASVMWLHRRKELRAKLGLTDLSDLRHYSIIITSGGLEIWQASFAAAAEDSGLSLRRLDDDVHLTKKKGVRRYAEWSNAIHAWGLGPHAATFKQEAEKYVEMCELRRAQTRAALEKEFQAKIALELDLPAIGPAGPAGPAEDDEGAAAAEEFYSVAGDIDPDAHEEEDADGIHSDIPSPSPLPAPAPAPPPAPSSSTKRRRADHPRDTTTTAAPARPAKKARTTAARAPPAQPVTGDHVAARTRGRARAMVGTREGDGDSAGEGGGGVG